MASQQTTKEAAANESRANTRETMAVLTSGARQKVDTAFADAAVLGQQMLHPFDKNARVQAKEAAEEKKIEAVEKRDGIRAVAQQQATQNRLAARGVKPESAGGQIGENFPSAQPAGQQGIHAPVDELDRADPPTSERQRTTLGEMLGGEIPENNPHIQHIEGNDVYNAHLDRNIEFRNDNVMPTQSSDENSSPVGDRDISRAEPERVGSERGRNISTETSDVNRAPQAGRNISSVGEDKSISESE